jgi:hypothetical protein
MKNVVYLYSLVIRKYLKFTPHLELEFKIKIIFLSNYS